jgi:aerobic carbon-monoxide dehydrogenase medium subunit
MIANEFEYSVTTQLGEALELIANGAKPLAGGQSLVPMMKLRLAMPEHVVDLRRIKDLSYVREDGDRVRVGATTTHHAVESSPVLLRTCPLLARTAAQIGDVQVRNMGTIGGSVAHADPSADYLAALFALEAEVRVKSSGSERTVSIGDFVVDPFTTTLEPGEIVSEIAVPAEAPGTGTAYVKMSQPASGFAMVGIAVRVRRSGANIEFIRIGVTGVGPTAYRARAAEDKLMGTAASGQELADAAALVSAGVDVASDLNASAEYRARLAAVHTSRAVRKALSDIPAAGA